jgi:hypothetical protein
MIMYMSMLNTGRQHLDIARLSISYIDVAETSYCLSVQPAKTFLLLQ